MVVLAFAPSAEAVELGAPPPDAKEEGVALDSYLREMQRSSRNLVVVTTHPHGNRRGRRGDMVMYNDGFILRMCRNNSTTAGGGTSWGCWAASTDTRICIEGATIDANEACFVATDPTADRTFTFPDASLDFTATAPSLTLSTTNAAGSATTFVRTDATVAAFDVTAPVTQAFADVAVTGSAAVTARRDHRHGMPANPALVSNIVAFTQGAGGTVGYTGMGFQPDALLVFCGSGDGFSVGMGDDDANDWVSFLKVGGTANLGVVTTTLIAQLEDSAANTITATLDSLDADGFTLTWSTAGTPQTASCAALGIAN